MENRRRNIRISVRLTAEEHKTLKEKSDAAGLSMSETVCRLAANIEIKPRPPDSYKELARELSAIGNNLNQIAHQANSTGMVDSNTVRKATDIMQQVWALVWERV